MTPQDMNVKIAKILGYKVTGNDYVSDDQIHLIVPQYTTDKALCWDLMEMLGDAGAFIEEHRK